MIRTLILLALLFCVGAPCWAATEQFDPPSYYWPGGKDYLPPEQYGVDLCHNPRFHCEKVKPGEDWPARFPNKMVREVVMRLNRTNVSMAYLTQIVVPRNVTDVNYMSYSPLPPYRNTHGHKLLYVDLSLFAFGAYDSSGALLFWGPASGGSDWCDDTHASCASAMGTFSIFKIEGANCESGTFPVNLAAGPSGGAPMPYCMYYHDGFAIHGSTLSGFVDRSHGCVRLFNDDAQWLNEHFVSLGTQVIVTQ